MSDPYAPRDYPFDDANPYATPSPARDYEAEIRAREMAARSGNMAAPLDPQPIGLLQSGTVKTALIGGSTLLVALGVRRFVLTDQTAQAIADGVVAVAAIVTPILTTWFRVRAASIVVPWADAPTPAVKAAKVRRDVVAKVAKSRPPSVLFPLLASVALATASTGCQQLADVLTGTATTRPAEMSPIVRVYVARQVYASTVPALADAIRAGLFDDSPDVLRAIAATKRTLENAFGQAEAYADAGRAKDFEFWIARVDATLNEFLKLSRPGQRAIPLPPPTTRPASSAHPVTPEVFLWAPSPLPNCSRTFRSSASSSPAPSRVLRPVANIPYKRNPQSAPPRRWWASTSTARSSMR